MDHEGCGRPGFCLCCKPPDWLTKLLAGITLIPLAIVIVGGICVCLAVCCYSLYHGPPEDFGKAESAEENADTEQALDHGDSGEAE